jgi:serine/threonine-protein kinase
VDTAGNVYVAEAVNNRVVKIPAGGGAETTVGTALAAPYGVAVDASGNVFIADSGHRQVLKVPVGGGTQSVIDTSLHYVLSVAVG